MRQTYETFIKATPEQLWGALTDGEQTRRYFFGTSIRSSFTPGAALTYERDGQTMVSGKVLEVEHGRRLVTTWRVHYDPTAEEETSRVTWLLEPRGAMTKLTAIHDLEGAPRTAAGVATDGWSLVLSGLKTVLETGRPLDA